MKLTIEKDQLMRVALALFVAYALLLVPDAAMAQDAPEKLTDVLCNVVGWFEGSIGAGIATLAIIVIGVGALMGKVSWGMAIIVGLGVGVIFGAPQIVEALGGNGSC